MKDANAKKIVITGLTLAGVTQFAGIQRACRELLLRLDSLLEHETLEIEYVYTLGLPNLVIRPEELRNIKAVGVKKPFWARSFLSKFWVRSFLARYIRRNRGVGFCLATERPFGKRCISFIYDLRPVVTEYDPLEFRKIYKKYLRCCKRNDGLILTDSDFQNALIRNYFGWGEDKVKTIYMGWEHIAAINADESIFKKFPALTEKGYFYTLGSLAPHKNFQWILEVAKRNPDKIFVIAGGKDVSLWKDSVQEGSLSNVIFPGRVTDEENKALLKHCRAFLFPSKFEGFGIPPLEALACGAEIALSNATCLPEVYGDTARYFDPDDYDVNLDRLMAQPVSDPDKLLERCTWQNAAQRLLDVLKEACK